MRCPSGRENLSPVSHGASHGSQKAQPFCLSVSTYIPLWLRGDSPPKQPMRRLSRRSAVPGAETARAWYGVVLLGTGRAVGGSTTALLWALWSSCQCGIMSASGRCSWQISCESGERCSQKRAALKHRLPESMTASSRSSWDFRAAT